MSPGGPRLLPRSANSLHRAAFDRFAAQAAIMLEEFERLGVQVNTTGAFERMVRASFNDRYPELDCSRVIVPTDGARVDPMPFVPADRRELLTSPSSLFPNGTKGVAKHVAYKGPDRQEYIGLVIKELRGGKARLTCSPCAACDVFTVRKRDKTEQR